VYTRGASLGGAEASAALWRREPLRFEKRNELETAPFFARFGLTLHPDKTRRLEFGRHAAANRRARGKGKPDSFNFLGFTHSCARTRKGGFTVLLRRTMRTRMQAKKSEVRQISEFRVQSSDFRLFQA
jgi:hypothetical protein